MTLLAFIGIALLAAFGTLAWVNVVWWRERRRWRRYARERGLPLCKRCRLPEEHYDHGSYGLHMFEEPGNG